MNRMFVLNSAGEIIRRPPWTDTSYNYQAIFKIAPSLWPNMYVTSYGTRETLLYLQKRDDHTEVTPQALFRMQSSDSSAFGLRFFHVPVKPGRFMIYWYGDNRDFAVYLFGYRIARRVYGQESEFYSDYMYAFPFDLVISDTGNVTVNGQDRGHFDNNILIPGSLAT